MPEHSTQDQHQAPGKAFVFYSHRSQRDSKYFEFYRCYAPNQELVLSARAERFGKPLPVYQGMDDGDPVIDIRNAKGYLVNGRTEIRELATGQLFGSYTRLGAILDADGNKIARWRDARKWSEELKENLVDALANTLLGSGDVPAGANAGDTQLLSDGKTVIARLQKQRLDFFPDPPRSESPGRFARLAGRVIPGELGRSIRENLPPYGWLLYLAEQEKNRFPPQFLLCTALVKLEMMRWSRSS